MDQTTQNPAPATDDQELAKVLAGMNEQAKALETPAADDAAATAAAPAPVADPLAPAADPAATAPAEPAAASAVADPLQYEASALPAPAVALDTTPTTPAVDTPVPNLSPELETLKKDALEELRPLVDKLDLPAEEKFDTLLLIIRSTDDQALLPAAHEAAKAIEDETKRAQALLDVIKEIDFFGSQKTA
jgi:hypothetical protein